MTQQETVKGLLRFEEKCLRFLVSCKKRQNHREVCAAFAILARLSKVSDQIAKRSDEAARDYVWSKFSALHKDFTEMSIVLVRAFHNDGRAPLNDELMELLTDAYRVERDLCEYTRFAFTHLYL